MPQGTGTYGSNVGRPKKSLLSNVGDSAYKFYKNNETAIDVASFLVPGGFIIKGGLMGLKYMKAAGNLQKAFNATNKAPKLKYMENRGYSGNWVTQNRAKTQLKHFKNVDSYNAKVKAYKAQQSALVDKDMPTALLNVGVGAGLTLANLKRLQNSSEYKARMNGK